MVVRSSPLRRRMTKSLVAVFLTVALVAWHMIQQPSHQPAANQHRLAAVASTTTTLKKRKPATTTTTTTATTNTSTMHTKARNSVAEEANQKNKELIPPPQAANKVVQRYQNNNNNLNNPNNHCVFIVTSYTGNNNNHDDKNHSSIIEQQQQQQQRNATLQWYTKAMVPSVQRAAEFAAHNNTTNISLEHVSLMMFAQGIYDTEEARDFVQEQLQQSSTTTFSSSSKTLNVTVLLTNFAYQMRQTIARHSCNLISVMRLPHQDLLAPEALQNLHGGWDHHVRLTDDVQHRARQQRIETPQDDMILVTRSDRNPTIQLWPSNEKSNMTATRGNHNNMDKSEQQPCGSVDNAASSSSFSSSADAAGFTVTLPVTMWMHHFGGNSHSLTHRTPLEFEEYLVEHMRPHGIAVHTNPIVSVLEAAASAVAVTNNRDDARNANDDRYLSPPRHHAFHVQTTLSHSDVSMWQAQEEEQQPLPPPRLGSYVSLQSGKQTQSTSNEPPPQGCGRDFWAQYVGRDMADILHHAQAHIPHPFPSQEVKEMRISSSAPNSHLLPWNGTLILPEEVVVEKQTLRVPDFQVDRDSLAKDDNKVFHHCIFTITHLWGNHTRGRRDATLKWLAHAMVPSVRHAMESSLTVAKRQAFDHNDDSNSNKNMTTTILKHVGLSLSLKDSYGTASALEFLWDNIEAALGKDESSAAMPSLDFSLANHTIELRQRVQENQCNLVSFSRIDADDMLEHRSFEHVRQGWNLASTQGECTVANNCPVVVVTGTRSIQALNMFPTSQTTNHTATDPRQAGPCSSLKVRKLPDSEFWSLGLTVTMPTWVWMRHFGGDAELAVTHHHKHLLIGLSNTLTPRGITVYENAVAEHGLYMKTMLSGHFDVDADTAKATGEIFGCGLDFLTRQLGNESGHLVWNAKSYIPDLTKDEVSQNTFVKEIQTKWKEQQSHSSNTRGATLIHRDLSTTIGVHARDILLR